MTHHRQELRLRAIGCVSSCPRFFGFADRSAQLLVGKSQLVGQLSGLVGLVRQLLCLRLEEVITLFEVSHARSCRFTLPGHPHSANYRVDLREGEWHLAPAAGIVIVQCFVIPLDVKNRENFLCLDELCDRNAEV